MSKAGGSRRNPRQPNGSHRTRRNGCRRTAELCFGKDQKCFARVREKHAGSVEMSACVCVIQAESPSKNNAQSDEQSAWAHCRLTSRSHCCPRTMEADGQADTRGDPPKVARGPAGGNGGISTPNGVPAATRPFGKPSESKHKTRRRPMMDRRGGFAQIQPSSRAHPPQALPTITGRAHPWLMRH